MEPKAIEEATTSSTPKGNAYRGTSDEGHRGMDQTVHSVDQPTTRAEDDNLEEVSSGYYSCPY